MSERVTGERVDRCPRVVPVLQVVVHPAGLATKQACREKVTGLCPGEHPADVDVGVLDEGRVVSRDRDPRAGVAQDVPDREVVGVTVRDDESVDRHTRERSLVLTGIDDQTVDETGVGQSGHHVRVAGEVSCIVGNRGHTRSIRLQEAPPQLTSISESVGACWSVSVGTSEVLTFSWSKSAP